MYDCRSRETLELYCDLNHICLMDYVILSLFPVQGVSAVFVFLIFISFLIEITVSKQCSPDQTPRFVASDLGLHCLPRSQKWDVRHEWFNFTQCTFCIFFQERMVV